MEKVKDKYYYSDGSILNYFDENKIHHREDGPATEYSNGTKEWFINGVLHREDGPAIIYFDGEKRWVQNGRLHRKGGPAIECKDEKVWHIKGKRHRLDGPAVEGIHGYREWWIDGINYTKEEHGRIIKKIKQMNPGERLTDPRWWVREWKK